MSVGTIDDPTTDAAVDRILQLCFGAAPGNWPRYRDLLGVEQFRVWRVGGEVAAVLGLYRFGQDHGGRLVPMAGVAAVGSPPEHRGLGHVNRLLVATLEELRDRGEPISVLFPASCRPYRKVGYELAGAAYLHSVQASAIGIADHGLAVRTWPTEDLPALGSLYDAMRVGDAGLLARSPASWQRVGSVRGAPRQAWVVGPADAPEGYVVFRSVPTKTGHHDVDVGDFVATTPAALRRIWTLLSDLRSLANAIRWQGPALDHRLMVLDNPVWKIEAAEQWMLRVVDLPRALQARGWPVDSDTPLDLDVSDDVLPANAGRWRIEVQGGEASVARGGSGGLRIDIRGLAALYTGAQPPARLRAVGLLDGDDATLASAARLFASAPPWMADFF